MVTIFSLTYHRLYLYTDGIKSKFRVEVRGINSYAQLKLNQVITRGIIIGRIIDDLSSLTEKIEFRAKLQLFDIHRILENFIRDILQIVLNYDDIENLNATRVNTPGLDLGTSLERIGFQVTSKANSQKINDTFEKINPEHLKIYDCIKFIVIGKKQTSYTAIDHTKIPDLITFDIDSDILDFHDLAKLIFDINIEKLLELKNLFDKEFLIVKHNVSFEDEESSIEYQTPLYQKPELVKAVNGHLLFEGVDDPILLEGINNDGLSLCNLPIRTRKLLLHIIKHGKETTKIGNLGYSIYYLLTKLRRDISLPPKVVDEEVNILLNEKMLYLDTIQIDHDYYAEETAAHTMFHDGFDYLIDFARDKNRLDEVILGLNLSLIDK